MSASRCIAGSCLRGARRDNAPWVGDAIGRLTAADVRRAWLVWTMSVVMRGCTSDMHNRMRGRGFWYRRGEANNRCERWKVGRRD